MTDLWFFMSNIQDLVENAYPQISTISTKTYSEFQKRIILSLSNELDNKINGINLLKFNALTKMYSSVDTILNKEEAEYYSTKF